MTTQTLLSLNGLQRLLKGGKAGLVKDFMNDIGAELLIDEYQIAWRL